MHTDPIADLLTRIRNAARAGHTTVSCPWSRIKEDICRVLTTNGYLASYTTDGVVAKKMLVISLLPEKAQMQIKRVSTPGRHVYADSSHLPSVFRGLGTAILSTSKGLMTNREARQAHVGGEVLLEVW